MIEWLQGLPAEWGNYVSILLFCSLGAMCSGLWVKKRKNSFFYVSKF